MRSTFISPSLLACDFLNIETELERLKNIENIWLHLDIMDGHFVPNLTFGHPIIELISKKTNILLDAHFMVTNPDFYIETLKSVKLHNFTFHLEAETNPLPLIKKAKQFFPSVGLSIKPNTPESSLSDEILESLDLVLVMSVEPGFGGQKFMPNSLEKVKSLVARRQKMNLSFSVQIDGGINHETSKLAIDAGCDNLVAGSYVFNDPQKNYSRTISSLRN